MQKLQEIISSIEEVDHLFAEKAQKRLDNLTKPQGSLGRLEEFAKQAAAITRNESPAFANKVVFTMAGDHGVAKENVSAFPQEVTAQMVYNFLRGGAGINVLAKHTGARVVVVDMGIKVTLSSPGRGRGEGRWIKDKKIGFGTKNITKGPAMTKEDAVRAIEAGIDVFEEELSNGIDIIGTGDMGIGNTTSSSAIAASLTGRLVEDVTGRGTGIDDRSFADKIRIIKEALEVNSPDSGDPLDVLSKVGGFEIGGIVGLILGAASNRVPVVIDGFISGAAALVAYRLEPKIKDYLFAAHCSVEKGHRIILEHIGLRPILDFDLRLGEGTGAALAMGMVEAGVKILGEMATFGDAGVSKEN